MQIIDDDLEAGGDYLVYSSDRGIWTFGHVFPTSTFVAHGIINCQEHHGADLTPTFRQLLP